MLLNNNRKRDFDKQRSKMTTIKTVKIPIYFGTLKIVISDDMGKFAASKGLDSHVDYEAITFEHRGEIYIMFSPKCSLHAIAHDSKHVVNYVFKRAGLQLDLDNDEAECYLLGWVFNECYKFLTKTTI